MIAARSMHLAALTCIALLAGLLASSPANAAVAPSASAATSTSSPVVAAAAPAATLPAAADARKKAKKKKQWRPKPGVIFNSAVGGNARTYKIFDRIRKAIQNSKKGSRIDIMSWNVMSAAAVNDLLAAQRRGVRVRVLMDRRNRTEVPNPQWDRLKREFRAYNKAKGWTGGKRSLAKECVKSCRGTKGQAHAKYYLFSKTGKTKWVTMHGSANLTLASAINQWNDLFTWTERRNIYKFTRKVFRQSWKDKPRKKPFVQFRNKSRTLHYYFTPFKGSKRSGGDPALRLLQQVRCNGAARTKNGRTRIRVAPDVMRHNQGMAYAKHFARLHRQGCDVRIGYTILGIDIKKHLDRAGVPLRHLVVDRNGDKIFDKYFHMKSMTIVGRIGNDANAYAVLNGSANMSRVAAHSDENVSIMTGRPKITLKYQEHIDYWLNNFPKHAPVNARFADVDVDPYQNIDRD